MMFTNKSGQPGIFLLSLFALLLSGCASMNSGSGNGTLQSVTTFFLKEAYVRDCRDVPGNDKYYPGNSGTGSAESNCRDAFDANIEYGKRVARERDNEGP